MNPARVAAGLARSLLRPVAHAYGGAAALRRAAYSLGLLHATKVPVPVISVGGLACGGEGKTPVARAVAERLLRRGRRVGIVVGGYRGTDAGRVQRVPVARWWEADRLAVARYGDEAVLLSSWLPECVVVCGADKARGAAMAVELGCEVVVVDDGLQHLRLARDLDILVSDGAPAPLPLPAGDGREWGAFIAAHLNWRHGRGGVLPPSTIPAGSSLWSGRVRSAVARASEVVSRNVPIEIVAQRGSRLGPPALLRGLRVFLVVAVARPQAFAEMVGRLGAKIVGSRLLRDHRALRPVDLRQAARSGADLVLCTEKDAARMAHARTLASDLAALTCTAQVEVGERLIAGLLDGMWTDHRAFSEGPARDRARS